MRRLTLLALIGLSACATAPETGRSSVTSAKTNALPPQDLAVGGCGLFAWDAGDGRFVFFAGDQGGQVHLDGVNQPIPASDDGVTFGPVELRLGTEEAMAEGTRYPEARMISTTSDGFRRVQPVVALRSCRRS